MMDDVTYVPMGSDDWTTQPVRHVSTPHDQFPQPVNGHQWWHGDPVYYRSWMGTAAPYDDHVSHDFGLKQLELIKTWIDNKHTTLWATFNVGPEGDTYKAATWFLRELQSFTKFLEETK